MTATQLNLGGPPQFFARLFPQPRCISHKFVLRRDCSGAKPSHACLIAAPSKPVRAASRHLAAMLCHRIPAASLGSRQPARLAPRAALGTADAPPAPAAPAQGAAAVPARPLAPRAEPTRPHAEQAAEQSTLGHRLASGVVYAVERAAVALAGGHPATNSYLSGNFAPVEDERFDVGLEVVEGALPPELEGAFLRNGPNPAVPPTGGYHW